MQALKVTQKRKSERCSRRRRQRDLKHEADRSRGRIPQTRNAEALEGCKWTQLTGVSQPYGSIYGPQPE